MDEPKHISPESEQGPEYIGYYQRILEKFPLPTVISDLDDHNIFVNDKFTEILGYTVDEIATTEQWAKQAYPDQDYRKFIQEVVPEIGTESKKFRIQKVKCKNGTTKQIIFQDYMLDSKYFITILEDVSEKFQIQQNLREAQERFQRIVHNFTIPIIVSNLQQEIIYVNNKVENLFGYTIEDIPNNAVWMKKAYPDPDYRNRIKQEVAAQEKDHWGVRERNVTCKNGDQKIVLMETLKIGSHEYLTIFQDITAQREAEQQAKEHLFEYKSIIEDASDLIIQIDVNRIIRGINPACTELLGYTPEEMIGKDFREFVDSNYWDRMDRMGDLKIKGDLSKTIYEIAMIKKTGSLLFAEINTRFVYKDGKLIRAIAVIRDITRRKKEMEDQIQREKMDSIGILAGGIAHDFNNILTSILGSINLLQLDIENPENLEILKDLEKGTLRAKDLTNQLLTFSKGGSPVKRVESISHIITDTAKFALRGSKVKCFFEIQENLPNVNIDGNQFSQVINNLIINAMHAMPEGGSLYIRIKETQIANRSNHPLIDGKYILIEIEDTGKGIPKALQKHIFEPYFSTKPTGSGLGLATAYSIIQNHDGWLTFTSHKEQGTIFYIYLPAAQGESQIDSTSPIDGNLNKIKRILFLDDDESIHTIMLGFCNYLNIRVDSVYSSGELMDKFSHSLQMKQKYDAIITDLTLPGDLGGEKVLQMVRKLDPTIPVIVSSGYSNDPILANFREYGFNSYLKKPYTIDQLKAALLKISPL